MTEPRKDERGFTLVSVLVAVVLLALGVLALAHAQAQLTSVQGTTANRNTALAIARDYTEILRGRDPAIVVTEPATAVDASGTPTPGGPYTRTVTVTPDATNLLRVRVQVDYPRASRAIEIVTLIYLPTP